MSGKLNKYIDELHQAQSSADKKRLLEVEFKLAKYHYDNANFTKSKLFLESILKKDKFAKNINYYLALIEINLENYNLAIKYLEQELYIDPNNENAQKLKEKLKVQTNFPYITIFMLIINSLFFLLAFPEISIINSIKFGISTANLTIFSAITSIFFHINWIHFGINMFVLLVFGLILEKHIGSPFFFMIYILAGIIGNFFQAIFYHGAIVLGASGALFGILGALMVKEPLLKIKVLGIINIPIVFVLSIFFSLSLMGEIYLTGNFISGNMSHIMGLLIGIFISTLIFRERIYVFYHWIFIVVCFWIIQKIMGSVLAYGFTQAYEIMLYSFIIFICVMITIYSYYQLKAIEEFQK